MEVKLVYRGKEHVAKTGSTIRDAVKKIGLQPETVLAVLDGKLVTDDTVLREGMQIRLVAVISGGSGWPAGSGGGL